MNRLTKRTQKGAALKLDNPRTEKEARKQLHDKYLLAIEKLAAYEDTGLTPEEIMDGKMLTGWIPCSERLPSEEEFLKSYLRNHYAAEFLVQIYGASRPTTLYYRDGVWFDDDFDKYNVIAWMPLPEPWEGDKE
ncbi:DUF551 domain-containing protein [Anaerotruncus sp. 80]|uniref:DUF551 domain-containing protein n=1 Tax=Anaerotruncus colihominis TaxID=169435 RepID=A0A845QIN5_9FIRM|nr:MULTISPECIES: DUF551 domain-containing protein [Anaerotruncus]NBH61990.1 DUF551 domain-containing protein [Anaerotruncus colihominis]NCF02645.1 DUF551 domain-containing protein [Anaerotruncus sp. 80]